MKPNRHPVLGLLCTKGKDTEGIVMSFWHLSGHWEIRSKDMSPVHGNNARREGKRSVSTVNQALGAFCEDDKVSQDELQQL